MREPLIPLVRYAAMRRLLLLSPMLLAACNAAPPPLAQAAPASSCNVSGSRDWTAWINAMPGPDRQPTLIVTGTVETPTGGYRIEFNPTLRQNPADRSQLVATLVGSRAGDVATQAVTTHQVRGDFPLGLQQARSLSIRCGSTVLAEIAPLEKAY